MVHLREQIVASRVGIRGHDKFYFTINLYQFMVAMSDLAAIDIEVQVNDEKTFSKTYLRSDIVAQDFILASPLQSFQGSGGSVLVDAIVSYNQRDDRVSLSMCKGQRSMTFAFLSFVTAL